MLRTVKPGDIGGTLHAPASKSHTIRALLIATLAEGESTLHSVLYSADTRACLKACRSLGAEVAATGNTLRISGVAGAPGTPTDVIDVGNSGTTLYLAAGAAALQSQLAVFTGDEQIRNRPAAPLLASLRDLGARAESTRAIGCPPFFVGGGLRGGETSIECPTSQYLSSLLLAAPLADGDTRIEVPLLHERPYVDITIGWLNRQDIKHERRGYEAFAVPGNQGYHAFEASIPGDYSSATFFLCAAAITGSTVRIEGLEADDTQGDRAVLDILESMGCVVVREPRAVEISGRKSSEGGLQPGIFDLNSTPDALPALAVTACFAEGETHLSNVPQAREKETDRIAVICSELRSIGADIDELPDGLVIRGRPDFTFSAGGVSGHSDHRIAMALSIAALRASGPLAIDTAECVEVTFPAFFDLLEQVRQPQ